MLFFSPPLPLFSFCCGFSHFCSQILCFPWSHHHCCFITHPCSSSFHSLLSILANLVMRHNVIHRKYWSATKEFVLLSIYAQGQIHIRTVYSHSYMRWSSLDKMYGHKQATKQIKTQLKPQVAPQDSPRHTTCTGANEWQDAACVLLPTVTFPL